MPATTYLVQALSDHAFGGPSYTRSATVDFCLYTAAPTTAGGGTEVATGGYSPITQTNDSTLWPAASVGKATIPDLDYGDIGTPTIVAIGVKDAGGNLLCFATEDVDGNPISITPNPGDSTKILAGSFVVELLAQLP